MNREEIVKAYFDGSFFFDVFAYSSYVDTALDIVSPSNQCINSLESRHCHKDSISAAGNDFLEK